MTIDKVKQPEIISQYLNDILRRFKTRLVGKKGEDWEESWKDLYDFIFSEDISKKIYEAFPDFHYYDPDTTYEEDVLAFIRAFDEYSNYNTEKAQRPEELINFEDWYNEYIL